MRKQIAPPQSSVGPEFDERTDLSTLRDHLLRYCEQLSGSRDEAEDLVQTTLLKGLAVVQGKPHPNKDALLRRIAKNTWIDKVRKQRPYRLCDPGEMAAVAGSSEPSLERSELESAIYLLIQRLTRQQQAVFLLNEAFEYTDRETAELLGISRGAVKAALHRARMRLASMSAAGEVTPAMDESQQAILKAYVSAFQAADVRALIQLCEGGVFDAVQATGKVLASGGRMQTTRRTGATGPRCMFAAA